MRKYLLIVSAMFMAMSASAQNELITEQPAGELRHYHGYSIATEASVYGFVEESDHDGVTRQVVFADNGVDVYFKDPLSKSLKGTWIKGTLKDGIITVETPQVIWQTKADDGSVDNWCVQRLAGTEIYNEERGKYETVYSVDTEKTAMTYIYRNDSIIQEDKGIKLGLTLDGEPVVYGDVDVVYARVDEKTSKMPEGVEPEIWSLKCLNKRGYAYQQIKAAIVDNEVFIKGLWEDYPDACIKGIIEGDKMYIPSKQYIGWMQTSSGNSYYTYYMNTVEDYNLIYMPGYTATDKPMEFVYDKENRTFTGNSDLKGIIKYGKTVGSYEMNPLEKFIDVYLAYTDVNNIAVPATPKITWLRYEEDYGWGSVDFDIYPEDINGNCLDINNFYYSLFLDDEVLLFDPEDPIDEKKYAGIDEPTTEIAYTFLNGSGFDTAGSMTARAVQYFKIGFDEIGVMAIYKNPVTGERQLSDIYYYNRNTKESHVVSGISKTLKSNAEIAGVSYHDICGRKVDASYKGMVIMTVRYTDGTVKTVKTVNR